MSLLEQLVDSARRRARDLPAVTTSVRPRPASFGQVLAGREHLDVIAEHKRASPSRGSLASERDVVDQVRAYEEAGAAAVSVLTEPEHFGGSAADLERAADAIGIPILMKDFIVETSQVELAASLGASAVLLIVCILDEARLAELAAACDALDLTPLVECHDCGELDRALAIESAVIGVNNRDLSTLRVDRGTAPLMLARVPAGRVAVAESGYETPEQARELAGLADAVLIGSSLMTSADPGRFIREVRA